MFAYVIQFHGQVSEIAARQEHVVLEFARWSADSVREAASVFVRLVRAFVITPPAPLPK